MLWSYAVSTGGSVARLVNLCAPGTTGDPLCGSLRLSAGTNQPSFAPGETLTATGFDNPGLADTADVYIGVLQPDQTVVTFTMRAPPRRVLWSTSRPSRRSRRAWG